MLHVVLNLHQGGLERVVGDLIRGMDRSAFDVHLMAVQFLGHLSEGLARYCTLHTAPRQAPWSLLWPAELRGAIAAIRPDIVHSHSGVWYKASLAARMAGVPYLVHTDHGRQSPDPFFNRFYDRLASRRTDVVIAVSNVLGRQLAATVVSDPSRIVVVRNGVDTDAHAPHARSGRLRTELGIAADAPIIGSIGRLDPIKCFDVMIQAFASLRAEWPKGPPPELVIAGDGPDRERLERLIAETGVGASVHLLGWRQDIQDLHEAFTLFSMSSRSEGTSIGLLEAMSAQICPVVTAVGGNPDVLGPDLQHRLCQAENARSLADAWRDALVDEPRRTADAIVARERVESTFSLRSMVATHEALYRDGYARTRGSSAKSSSSLRPDVPSSDVSMTRVLRRGHAP